MRALLATTGARHGEVNLVVWGKYQGGGGGGGCGEREKKRGDDFGVYFLNYLRGYTKGNEQVKRTPKKMDSSVQFLRLSRVQQFRGGDGQINGGRFFIHY